MRYCLWIAIAFLTGCASTPSHPLKDVRVGMDKDQVLAAAGSPKRTFREHAQDNWIYSYFQNNQQLTQILTFDDGKVIRISAPKSHWEKDLENSSSMEEFEKKAKEHGKKGKFKSIDGGPSDPNQP